MSLGKKRILFVDDDEAILASLANLMFRERRRWEGVTACGGARALDELERGTFDAVVSDMRMPGMDGAELLQIVKDRYPATARLMLTGHADQEAIVRALPVTHQVLSKPCDAATLRGAIATALAVGCDGAERVARVIGGLDKLPTPRSTYAAFVSALESPATSTDELAAIVASDPGLSAKVLQLVNSAYFGGGKKTAAIAKAVAVLGPERLRHVSTAVSLFGALGNDPEHERALTELQARSVEAARAAQLLAPECEEAYASGLLRDLGCIVLQLGMSESYREVVARMDATGEPVCTAERAVLGVSHAEVGAALLALWGLPDSVVQRVRYHHDV